MNNLTNVINKKDEYKLSRILYIIEAALEYFISLGVAGDYITIIGLDIGMPENLIAIVDSFIALGASFQLFAVFLANKRPYKPWVCFLHIISQIFFALIFFIPLFKFSSLAKVILFVSLVLVAQIIHNIVNSPKISWFMSLVDDHKRGAFTANKEIISLIGGMLFSFGYGAMVTHFQNNGQLDIAFILCGALLLLLMFGHTATLLFSKEKPDEGIKSKNVSVKDSFKKIIADKNLIKVMIIPVLWNITHYISFPYFATYKNIDLAFTPLFISLTTAAYSIIRAIFSKPLGRLADKFSFTKMLSICLIIEVIAYFLNIFTVPSNGYVMYTIFYVLYGIGMAGISSSTINIIYDYVDHDNRTSALAIKSAFAGILGFLSTLAVSPLVSFIRDNGNKFLCLNVYPAQVLSAISCIIVIVILLYNIFVVGKIKRAELPIDNSADN